MNDISTELGRRERKRLQQLDHLADTAWTLFEAEGYEAVTMRKIAQAIRLLCPEQDPARFHESDQKNHGRKRHEQEH